MEKYISRYLECHFYNMIASSRKEKEKIFCTNVHSRTGRLARNSITVCQWLNRNSAFPGNYRDYESLFCSTVTFYKRVTLKNLCSIVLGPIIISAFRYSMYFVIRLFRCLTLFSRIAKKNIKTFGSFILFFI